MCGNHDLVVMPVTPSTVNRDPQALIAKTGVPAGTMHGLWHGSSTIVLRAGVFPALVALKPGHAYIGTTVDQNGHLAVAVLAVTSAALEPACGAGAPRANEHGDHTMQTYRLTIGPDGQVRIPNGKPGQVVTVQVESQPVPPDQEPLTFATARTPEERDAVIVIMRENAQKLRELLKDAPPFTTDDLYGEDGLPA